jgi:hypothetical protein
MIGVSERIGTVPISAGSAGRTSMARPGPDDGSKRGNGRGDGFHSLSAVPTAVNAQGFNV